LGLFIVQYADLEGILGDTGRARGIYNLAINQPRLDMPEMLWKSFIDFEIEQKAFDRVRQLYEHLLQRTSHVKVRICSFGNVQIVNQFFEKIRIFPGLDQLCAV
jgi:crooked neck